MIKKGLAIAVVLLFIGVAFAIPINANVSKSSLEPVSNIEVLEEEDGAPIEFELQRIRELINTIDLHKMIVETDVVIDALVEISTIIEENQDVIDYIEKTSDEDCGCEDESTDLEWMFPVVCTLLYPLSVIAGVLFLLFHIRLFYDLIWPLGTELNCFWASPDY